MNPAPTTSDATPHSRSSAVNMPPSPRDDGAHLADVTVSAAVAWYVQMASGSQTPDQHADFTRWLGAHPDHARAWLRLRNMGGLLQASTEQIEPDLTRTTLVRIASVPTRRRAIKAILWVGTTGGAAYLVQEQIPWRRQLSGVLADQRTARGERRDLMLADGTRLMLNTATAVDVRYDVNQRRIVLRGGEIMIATAPDAAGRPFVVATEEGTLTPVGTRFTVRRDDGDRRVAASTRLAVSEGAVQVRAANRMSDEPVRVPAGRQVRFSSSRIDPSQPLKDEELSWTDGTLIAEGMRLDEFIAELGRYRPGLLRCAPEVGELRITGAWPLHGGDPTERILASLERRLPVTVIRRTRYWVTIAARR